MINPEKSKISYKMFDFNEPPMKMNYFDKARCPGCYSFSGNIIGGEFDGLKFEGTTTGTMTNEGYQVSMKLVSPKIEAGKSFPCK